MNKNETTSELESASKSDESVRITHAHRSFEHTQGVIQFVDSKTNVLIGLVLAVSAVTFYFIRFDLGLESNSSSSQNYSQKPCLNFLKIICFSASILSGGISIILCTWTNISRPRATSGESILLFPIHQGKSTSELNSKREQIKMSIDDLDEERIIEEFADQLSNLGSIVGRKIRYHRYAIIAFVIQMAFATLASVGWLLIWI